MVDEVAAAFERASAHLVLHLGRAAADRLVDHLPDLLIELVLLPNAVRGAQQHRRHRYQPDRPAHRRIDPLVSSLGGGIPRQKMIML